MNNLKKRLTLTIALVLGLLTLAQAGNFNKADESKIKLTAELNETNEPSLSWETSLEANYFKVYRATVNAEAEPSAELNYVEVGVSETKNFIDKNTMPDANMDKASSFVYYVSAIDAYDKEIGKSDLVKLSLAAPAEMEAPAESEGNE